MKITQKTNRFEILNSKLTHTDKGVLFVLFLCQRTEDPESALKMYLKKTLPVTMSLLRLENEGFIATGCTAELRKSARKQSLTDEVKEVIDYMAGVLGTKASYGNVSINRTIAARIEECSVEDAKKVIQNRFIEWGHDPYMSKFLRPSTIFRKSKFDNYMNEIDITGVGVGQVEAELIKLKEGDYLTTDNLKPLPDITRMRVKVVTLHNGEYAYTDRLARDIKFDVRSSESFGERRQHSYYFKKFIQEWDEL